MLFFGLCRLQWAALMLVGLIRGCISMHTCQPPMAVSLDHCFQIPLIFPCFPWSHNDCKKTLIYTCFTNCAFIPSRNGCRGISMVAMETTCALPKGTDFSSTPQMNATALELDVATALIDQNLSLPVWWMTSSILTNSLFYTKLCVWYVLLVHSQSYVIIELMKMRKKCNCIIHQEWSSTSKVRMEVKSNGSSRIIKFSYFC